MNHHIVAGSPSCSLLSKGWKQTDVRSREHLTPAEVGKLAAAANSRGRHGARDGFAIRF